MWIYYKPIIKPYLLRPAYGSTIGAVAQVLTLALELQLPERLPLGSKAFFVELVLWRLVGGCSGGWLGWAWAWVSWFVGLVDFLG